MESIFKYFNKFKKPKTQIRYLRVEKLKTISDIAPRTGFKAKIIIEQHNCLYIAAKLTDKELKEMLKENKSSVESVSKKRLELLCFGKDKGILDSHKI